MKIYYQLSDFPVLDYAVVTSGTFDGVHRGHQKILQRLEENRRQHRGESVVLTYHPHPRIVLGKAEGLQLLSTLEEKQDLLAQAGVQHLLVLPFTKEFSELSSGEFIQKILVETLRTRQLIIGYDHRFGKNREGGFAYLKTHSGHYGFEVEEIPAQEVDEITVSSTKIRNALLSGNLALTTDLLGHTYIFSGKVVKGRQLGRTLGFPTANLQTPDLYKLIPADGVYAVKVRWEKEERNGLLSIGTNPTVGGTHRTAEVWLLNFEGDLYDKTLTVSLLYFLRGQIKFAGLPELIAQMQQDEAQARQLLSL
jgi:riboflavin kinase / FMN adenylyltransferase